MKPIVDHQKTDKVTIRAEDSGKHLERVELRTREADTVKYVERKLVDKGIGRMERRPADGLPLKHDPKKGHGGKYTWEGPESEYGRRWRRRPRSTRRIRTTWTRRRRN